METKSQARPHEYATAKEIEEAVVALTLVDLERVRSIAHGCSLALLGCGVLTTGEDLLQRAMELALGGGNRRWPKHVPFATYLRQLVRNVASHEARRSPRSEFVGISAYEDLVAEGRAPPSAVPDAERVATANKELERIRKFFADDERVTDILDGLSCEMKPSEIRDALGISQNELETAMTRLRRGVRKLEG